ncbi:hypothetical protein SERLADRAFT_417762, partial [Serpula lacrymans var. lacrymans S7.9]
MYSNCTSLNRWEQLLLYLPSSSTISVPEVKGARRGRGRDIDGVVGPNVSSQNHYATFQIRVVPVDVHHDEQYLVHGVPNDDDSPIINTVSVDGHTFLATGSSIMSSSAIAFPSTDSASHIPPAPIPRPPHLPFRRISLPSAPNIALNRHSVVSLASFDSLLEEGSHTSSNLSPALAPTAILRNAQKHKSHLPPVDHARRNRRRTGVHIDEMRLAKRRRVIHEFYDTERTYADGLDLIYSHFLTPIIESLDTAHPLLSRVELTAVFSNFIDIWNFHRSFLTSLTAFISPSLTTLSSPLPSSPANPVEIPPLSPLLLAHFPYLSLYTPFITSFSTTISTLTTLSTVTSPPTAFATFLAKQELHPRCANFHLRDWLLTIVQRCPRYLLLLKDLINCTDPDDPEYRRLEEVHRLVSKITTSLNTSLSTHSQTLQLLAIQRSATNLPFPLVAPGRTFVKRGALLQIESKPASWWSDVRGSVTSLQREFLLFSDYLIWLEGGERESMWDEDGRIGRNKSKGSGSRDPDEQQNGGRGSSSIPNDNILVKKQTGTMMERSRSKSEAELEMLKAHVAAHEKVTGPNLEPVGASLSPPIHFTPSAPHVANGPVTVVPSPRKKKSQTPSQAQSNSNTGDKWVCKGNLSLVDVEIVVGSSSGREWGEERRFEILSPEGSFTVYAESTSARDAWTDAIRDTKASLLISLNAIHPNSTLTSSASTTHLRRSLQALPHSPRTVDESSRGGYFAPHLLRSDPAHGKRTVRHHVEHYVPPVWIPDAKISSCMRCGQAFGWRRRRHHCRLCGRCVCAGCSEKTFFIADPTSPTSSNSGKPARACDECYETVFPPLSEPVTLSEGVSESEASSPFPRLTSPPTPSPAAVSPTLASFPTWLSIPSRSNFAPEPEALMAIEEYSASGRNISSGSPSKQELCMLRGSPSRRDIYTESYYGNRASPR